MRNTFKHDLFIRHVLAVTLLLSAPVLEASEGHQQHAGSPSYEQLFEKAVFTEESLGDLDGAIELYRELSERSQADK